MIDPEYVRLAEERIAQQGRMLRVMREALMALREDSNTPPWVATLANGALERADAAGNNQQTTRN